MANWKEPGDGEYTRVLGSGEVVKVFEQPLFWRAAVDDRMIDDVFFDAREAIQAIDAWEVGLGNLTFHPVERRWFSDDQRGYSRKSQRGELKVIHSCCGSWKINSVPERCFRDAETAMRYADERLP
jgi:hypothetical protein